MATTKNLTAHVTGRVSETISDRLQSLGDYTRFVGHALKSTRTLWSRFHLLIKQCEIIGVSSTGIIVVAALFMGAVLGYQLYLSFKLFGAEALLGATVGVSLFRELAPAMTAIMVTGRAGAAMAAELASMRISEQIDALEVMAVDPVEYLVTPRIIAGTLMLPLLGFLFAMVASISGAYIGCGVMGLPYPIYWEQWAKYIDLIDLIHCTLKSATFGFIMTSMGCYFGFHARGGARSVGFATRDTVVVSCLSILFADYILTSILPFGYNWLKVT